MFAESLLESDTDSTLRSRQAWATALSISAQLLLLAVVVSVSLLRHVDLPVDLKIFRLPLVTSNYVPIITASPEGREPHSGVSAPPAAIRVPASGKTYFGKPQQQVDAVPLPFVLYRIGNGSDVLRKALENETNTSVVRPKLPSIHPVRISHLDQGQLLSQLQPVYPPFAKQAGIQGQVVLTAVINRSGVIESLQVKTGHPLLTRAALDAVKQWRYRPYILNGEPVEVETQVIVSFKLGR